MMMTNAFSGVWARLMPVTAAKVAAQINMKLRTVPPLIIASGILRRAGDGFKKVVRT
jgi:hypothetical protein